MNLASIELRYLVNEIGALSGGHYVGNIYGITRDSLLFKLHHPEKPDVFMMLSTSGIWITTKRIGQIEPNRLLKRLRNDLLRARLVKIEQMGAERIVCLTFNNFEKEFVLVAELFGDGNLVLCSSEMRILALHHSIDVRHRRLAVGLEYSAPPANSLNVFEINEEQFGGIPRGEVEAVRWVGKNFGFPKKYAEEILRTAGVDPRKGAGELSAREARKLLDAMKKLVGDVVGGNHRTVIVRGGDGTSEIYPVEVLAGDGVEHAGSFMEGLDRIFTEEIIESGREARAGASSRKMEEYRCQIEEQTRAMETVMRRAARISAVARSVTGFAAAGILAITDRRALDLLREQDVELVSLRGVPYLRIEDERVQVNPESSLQAVASALFDESKRQANAVGAIESQRRKTQVKIKMLESQSLSERDAVGFDEIIKRTWFQRYRWFFTSDDMIAIGGRDSSSNSAVIRKHLEGNDRVFHADIFGSPFFILKNAAGATASGLNEVAHATVCFSRAWREAMYGTGAYWVMPEQIKKAAPSGQFLPRGAFIVEGQRNSVKIATLKMAVGILRYGGDGRHLLTCGPPIPIKRHCLCYAVIEPSSGDITEAAKRIRLEFSKVHEVVAKSIPLDEFVRVLPAGGSHVTELGDGGDAGIG